VVRRSTQPSDVDMFKITSPALFSGC